MKLNHFGEALLPSLFFHPQLLLILIVQLKKIKIFFGILHDFHSSTDCLGVKKEIMKYNFIFLLVLFVFMHCLHIPQESYLKEIVISGNETTLKPLAKRGRLY